MRRVLIEIEVDIKEAETDERARALITPIALNWMVQLAVERGWDGGMRVSLVEGNEAEIRPTLYSEE